MRKRSVASLIALPLGGCRIPTLTAEDLCAEISQAVALRTLQCTDDPERANAAYDALLAGGACVAQLDTGEMEAMRACAVSVLKAPCDQVLQSADAASFWLSLDPSCADLWSFTPDPVDTGDTGGDTGDTGDTGPYVEPVYASCDGPYSADFAGDRAFTTFEVTLDASYGDDLRLDECAPNGSPLDVVFRLRTDRASQVTLLVQADGPLPEDLYLAVQAPGYECGVAQESCQVVPLDTEVEIRQSADGEEASFFSLQVGADVDLAAYGVRAIVTQLPLESKR